MAATPIEIRTGYFLTSLDRFGMNKILFMALINKTVYASNRTRMSGFQSVRYSNARDRHKMQFEYRRRFGIQMLTVVSTSHVQHPETENI